MSSKKFTIRICDVCKKGKKITQAEASKIMWGLSTGRHRKCAYKAMGNYTTNIRVVHKT